MNNKKFLVLFLCSVLCIMSMFQVTVTTSAATEKSDGEEITSFKTYYNKILKNKYGIFRRKQTGTMHNWEDKWMHISGVMGCAVQDFDSDGKKEMMVCVAEKLGDGKSSKIILQMYENGKSGIELASELGFSPYYDGSEVDFAGNTIISANQSVEASLIVNFIKRGKKQYIVCERNELQSTFADGSGRDYWLIEYKKNRLSYISSFTQTAGGSSDFQFTVFNVKNGKMKSKQVYHVYYSENRTYDTAIKKYFEEYNIKLNRNATLSIEVTGKSILLRDKRNMQLFSFYNRRIKGDWEKNIYKFCATTKGLNNLK